jgi:outer membrane protein assembly factor BamB
VIGFVIRVIIESRESTQGPRRIAGAFFYADMGRRRRFASSSIRIVPVMKLLNLRSVSDTVLVVFVCLATVRADWPRFRGPGGLGVAEDAPISFPVSFDVKTGAGVLWKVRMPAPGPSSPLVLGNRVLLTGATRTLREVMAFDGDSGKVLWRREVKAPGSFEPGEDEKFVWAASTPATDGERIYAIFGNGDLAAVGLDGAIVWARSLGKLDNPYGHASSLEVGGGRLLVQLDQGGEEDGKSRLLALDGKTGNTVWEAKRPIPASWSTPIVVRATGRDLAIACGGAWAIAYDLAGGAEVWRAKCLGGEVVPSPVFDGGLVYAVAIDGKLAAIRPDGSGDVTATGIVWSTEDDLPAITSPIASAGLVVMSSSGGLVTCRDGASGKKLWEKDYETTFEASPVLAGGVVRMIDEGGALFAFKLARSFEEVGRSELGEPCQATPALAPGRMVIRGRDHLFAIGAR